MDQDRTARRSRTPGVIGIVVGALFLAVGVAAFALGGGPIIGVIALVGGTLTVAASVLTLVRP